MPKSTLAAKHPLRSAKTAIEASLVDDEKFLKELRTLGKGHDATGEVEDVASGLKELMESTLETAEGEGADSDFYEAHAVLLNLKRKQMDSAGGMLAIARDMNDDELRKAATAFQAAQKASSESLTRRTCDLRGQDCERRSVTGEQDPGAFIGHEPEREAESIPGGVKPGDERVAAHDTAPGVPGEPDAEPPKTEFERHRQAGQAVMEDLQSDGDRGTSESREP